MSEEVHYGIFTHDEYGRLFVKNPIQLLRETIRLLRIQQDFGEKHKKWKEQLADKAKNPPQPKMSQNLFTRKYLDYSNYLSYQLQMDGMLFV